MCLTSVRLSPRDSDPDPRPHPARGSGAARRPAVRAARRRPPRRTSAPATPAARRKGYPHSGYKANSKKMWWRMYSGHNCTNYVAYRMVKSGMSAERPWSGTGMAYNWGRANKTITNQTPDGGLGRLVERTATASARAVTSPTSRRSSPRRTIVISEDSWSGDFHWRRSPSAAAAGRPASSTSTTARSRTPPPRHQRHARRSARRSPPAGSWTPAATLATSGSPTARRSPARPRPRSRPRSGARPAAVRSGSRRPSAGYVSGSVASVRTAAVAPRHHGQHGRARPSPARPGWTRCSRSTPAAWSPAPTSTTIQWYADGEPISGATGRPCASARTQFRQAITAR